MNRYSFRSGFTLIELLLYVSILASLLVSITMFFSLTNEARVKSDTINNVNSQASYAIDYITSTVRGASTISSPVAAASGSSLSLTVPTSANSPTVFALSNGAITVKKGTATAVALTSSAVSVSSMTITNLTRSGTNGVVKVSFMMGPSNTTGRAEYNYNETFTSSAEVSW